MRACRSDTVQLFKIYQTNGALSAGAAVATGSGPVSVNVAPSGRFVYVSNEWGASVSAYTVGNNGTLSGGATVTAGSVPFSVVTDPWSRFAYTANFNDSDATVFTIHQTTGALTAGTAAAAGSAPFSITTTGSIE